MLRKLLPALLLLGAVFPAVATNPVAGVDYDLVPPTAQSASSATKPPVTVTYYFSHYCGDCAFNAGPIDRWFATLPQDVTTLRVIVPIVGQAGKEPTNESYQTLLQLGLLPQIEPKLYALLSRGRSSLADRQTLLAWLGKEGVSADSFEKTAKSFSVAAKTARAQSALGRVMQLERAKIPIIIVDDRYLVSFTSISEIEKKVATLDALVAKARADRGLR